VNVFSSLSLAKLRGLCGLTFVICLLSRVGELLNQYRPSGAAALAKADKIQVANYAGRGYPQHLDSLPLHKIDGNSWPDGAGFQPDVDELTERRRKKLATRKVTAILYPQSVWKADWNGMLRVSTDGEEEVDIEPGRGSLVLFRSPDLLHEVLPSNGKERFSLTMWFNSEDGAAV